MTYYKVNAPACNSIWWVQRVCATTVSGGVLCGWMSGVVG